MFINLKIYEGLPVYLFKICIQLSKKNYMSAAFRPFHISLPSQKPRSSSFTFWSLWSFFSSNFTFPFPSLGLFKCHAKFCAQSLGNVFLNSFSLPDLEKDPLIRVWRCGWVLWTMPCSGLLYFLLPLWRLIVLVSQGKLVVVQRINWGVVPQYVGGQKGCQINNILVEILSYFCCLRI